MFKFYLLAHIHKTSYLKLKKMYKKYSSLLFTVFILSSFIISCSGCSNSNENNKPQIEKPTEYNIKLNSIKYAILLYSSIQKVKLTIYTTTPIPTKTYNVYLVKTLSTGKMKATVLLHQMIFGE